MPISIHLLVFGEPDFAVPLKMLLKPRRRAKTDGHERELIHRALSGRLPPRLLRDVLPD